MGHATVFSNLAQRSTYRPNLSQILVPNHWIVSVSACKKRTFRLARLDDLNQTNEQKWAITSAGEVKQRAERKVINGQN